MPYATTPERLVRYEYIIEVLKIRFGEVPNELVDAITDVLDSELLKTLHRQAVTIESLSDFQQFIAQFQSVENE